ncbi:transporter [Actinomyces timonensis]|uniref:Transporter n=1 Tax=Actinomyces timonensis TaxID=1288391 RepID=A0AAU8N0H1_9ACTO
MAAILIRLRWRLTLNAVTRSPWTMVGAALGALWALTTLSWVIQGSVLLGVKAGTGDTALVLGAAGALLAVGWMLVPLLIVGVDSTLDPRAMAAWIAPSRRLAIGLAAAGALGLPGIVTGGALLMPAVTWMVAGQWPAALLAVLMAPVALATCVLLSRIVVIGLGISTTRRGRDAVGVIAVVLFIGASLLLNGIGALANRAQGASLDGLRALARALSASPLGWALAAPGAMAQGRAGIALAQALGAAALAVLLVPIWERVVVGVMTGPARSAGRGGAYAAPEGTRDSARGAAGPAGALVWHRRLSPIMPSPAAAVAARCLRYWRTDPRYLAQVLSVVLMPVLMAVAGGLNGSAAAGPGHGASPSGMMTMALAPALMAVLAGWSLHNDLGNDSTALWSHISAGMRGRDDRVGRLAAALLWQVPAITAMLAALALWTGRWDMVPLMLGVVASLHGAGLAWSCVMGALILYEVIAPGESPLKSRTSGTILFAMIAQCAGLLIVPLVSAPVWGPAIPMAAAGTWAWGWAVLAGGALWGCACMVVGVVVGGRILDERRQVAVLATISSWPGHMEAR